MSRGFVKEPVEVPTLAPPPRATPLRLTPARLRRLQAELALEADPARREALAARLATAVAAGPPADPAAVAFGATVDLADGSGRRTFTLVDDDEIDVAAGRIGEGSPLARALLGKRAGERAVWHRPAGDREVRILAVRYEDG